MIIYTGTAKGKQIQLSETLPYPEGQLLKITIEPVTETRTGSPAAILQAMGQPPHLNKDDINALIRAIDEGKLPVQESGIFDQVDKT